MAALDVLATRARRLLADMPAGFSATVPGPPPPGLEFALDKTLPPEALVFARDRIVPALAALEAALPLVRDPDDGVWEGVSVSLADGKAFLVPRNHLGRRERLHVFPLDRSRATARHLADWFGSRETPPADTSWDAAQAARVVLAEDGHRPRPSYIDPGAVRLIEIAMAVEATTIFTCAGHPTGGYLVVREDAAGGRLAGALSELGWSRRPWRLGIVCDMPRPANLAARDALWRGTCSGLERLLGLAPDAGRDLLAQANLHQAARATPPRP